MKLIAAFAVSGAVVGGGILSAAPALAAEKQVATSSFLFDVDDATGIINDANARQLDGPYGTLEGWAGDAFDDAGTLTVSACGSSGEFGAETNQSGPGVPTATYVNGGLSTLTINWTLRTDCDDVNVAATLTFEGNYARWNYAFSGATVDNATFKANIYFDDDTLYDQVDATSVVAYTDATGWTGDSPSAWHFTGTGAEQGMSSTNGNDSLLYTIAQPTALTAIALLPDYSYGTGYASALAYLRDNASTLDETFGETLPIFFGTDGVYYEPQTFTTGVAVDSTVEYSYEPINVNDEDTVDYFADAARDDGIDYDLSAVPAGLAVSVTFDATTGLPTVAVTGTPTIAGSYTVPITFYQLEDREGDISRQRPLPSTLSITVDAAAGAAPTPAGSRPALAETGANPAPFIASALGLIVLGAGAAVLSSRQTRKA